MTAKRRRFRSYDEYKVKAVQLAHAWKDQLWYSPKTVKVDPDQIPPGFSPDLASAYRETSHGTLAEVIGAAERLIAGELVLFGHPVKLGAANQWHHDFIHGKVTPKVFWRKVPFLDASEVGDSKVIWELNRLQFLLPVAKAFFLTGDHRYYLWIRSTFLNWHRENPYPLGINWSSSLELAFRCITLDWIVRFCRTELHKDHEFYSVIVNSLSTHGRHIARYLSTYFSPNTHLTGEALALYLLGTRYPFLPHAAKWRKTGRRVLLECADIHILADGGYFERSTWYHRYTTEIYLLFSLLADEARDELPAAIRSKLALLGEFLLHSCRNDGTFPLIGDDDGGRLLALDEYAPGDARGLLALLAAYLKRGDFKYCAGTHLEPIWWLLGKQAMADFSNLRAQQPATREGIFARTGYAFLRDSWASSSPNVHISFDAGPHGTANCGHAHADALSLTLTIGLDHIIVDPGTYSYSTGKRNDFRGAEAHSGLLIEGLQTNVPDSNPFQWTQVNDSAKLGNRIIGDSFDLIEGSVELSPAPRLLHHSRKLLLSKEHKLLLIWDTLTGQGAYDSSIQFVLNGTDWKSCNGRVKTRLKSGISFTIQSLSHNKYSHVDISAIELSPTYLQSVPGSRIRFVHSASLPATHVTLLAWGENSREIAVDHITPNLTVLTEDDMNIWCCVGGSGPTDNTSLVTDAEACLIVTQSDELVAAEAHNVSLLRFQTTPLLQESERISHWQSRCMP